MTDDRADFAESQRASAAALGADIELHRRALETLELADRHGYSYTWRWLGVPIIQMPSDVMTLQEIIWETRPDAIIETGVARGGSVILYSSLLELLGEGIVVAIDIDIRPHNREAIESHPLAGRVRLVEGSSVDPDVVAQVRALVQDARRVMVILDSNHTHDHVRGELNWYGPLVSPGQFLVVADTVVEQLPVQTHRPRPWGPGDNPATALADYLREHPEFVLDEFYNAKQLMSSSPGGYVRRIEAPQPGA